MAYNTTEERLKVRGSEQITRDLKVNRDAFINGKAETGSIDDKGDLKVTGEILAGNDVTISGDLYVNGTEYINDSETAQTTDNYLVLRHNQTTPLRTDEYSGVAVHNYALGKTATITADKEGTWRVADNTETDTNYTNISYYNGTYYTGLTRAVATVISGMKTAFDEDELDESVYYNNGYYHFDGNHWYTVNLVDNKLTLGSEITSSTTIAALNALTREDLVYFRSLTITVINPVENQPLLTRAEAGDLADGQALTWDATNQKAVGKTIDTTVTSGSSNLITSGAVSTCVTNAINALDVSSVGGDGKYISAISETNGKISATATTMDTAPTADSVKAATSGGIKTAFDNEVTARNTAITNAINALDVSSAGGDGKYISAISETNGKISATATTMHTAPTASSTKAVTSGGVKTAINTAETNAKNLANATGTLAIAHGGTGQTTAQAIVDETIQAGLGDASADVADTTSIITTNQVGYSTTDKRLYRRPATALWNYIKGKISSVLGLTSTAYGGNAASASQADKGKNGSAYCAFGSNAFNSTAFTTCTGTVTVSNKAAADSYTPIALCTGTTAVGRSTGCGLTFNTCTGVIVASCLSGVANQARCACTWQLLGNQCYYLSAFSTNANSNAQLFYVSPIAYDKANCTLIVDKICSTLCGSASTATAACTACCLKDHGGCNTIFCWSGSNTTPTWVWGSSTRGVTCVYNPACFAVKSAGSATNSTCFNGCTFAQACTTIRSGLTSCTGTVTSVKVGSTSYSPSSGVISLPAYPAAQVQSDWNVTDTTSKAFIKNKPTIGIGDVTIADKAATNADTPIALCTGTKTVGKSSSCELIFNTCTGKLITRGRSNGVIYETRISTDCVSSLYSSPAGSYCYFRICTGNSSCAHSFYFGPDGYMSGNVSGNVCGRADCAVCIPNANCTCWYKIYVSAQ